MTTTLVGILLLYFVVGLLFAIYFSVRGITDLDKAARGTSFLFKVLISPGVLALWPYLLMSLLKGSRAPRPERNAHRDLAGREMP